jgi:CRP-like cAMP-binding protein
MPVDINSKEGQLVRQLIPLSTMPADKFEEICEKATIEEAKANDFLFKRDETKNELIYLIKGSVRLQSDSLIVEKISSEAESAKFALAHQIPRKIDAQALSTVRFLRLDCNFLNALPSISHEQEESNFMPIDEPEDDIVDDDWMTTLLKSPIFRGLPAANLQKIVMNLNEIQFNKGEIIIKQGEPGDHYYLIKKGRCLISRKPSANAREIKLTELHSQDTFGEDSLLSGEPRNVSITALTDTTLIRLSKDKFLSLIKEPSLKFIEHAQLPEMLEKGATLIDVRTPDDYKSHHLPHSINVPFFSLRVQLKSIDKKNPVIVICEDGKASEAAAFLLMRNKIQTQIAKGGMASVSTENIEPVATFDTADDSETLAVSNMSINAEATSEEPQPSSRVASDSLQIENQQLKQSIKTLQEEKIALEKKYRMLYKQTEKMKSILDALKK